MLRQVLAYLGSPLSDVDSRTTVQSSSTQVHVPSPQTIGRPPSASPSTSGTPLITQHTRTPQQGSRSRESTIVASQFRTELRKLFFHNETDLNRTTEIRDWILENGRQLPPDLTEEIFELLVRIGLRQQLEQAHFGSALSLTQARWLLDHAAALLHPHPAPRLQALTAILQALEHDVDAGLTLLKSRDDHYALGARIFLLIRDQRYTEAVDALDGRSLDVLRHHHTVAALVATGDLDAAEFRRRAAREFDDPNVALFSDIVYAQQRLSPPSLPADCSANERLSAANDAIRVLRPHSSNLQETGHVHTQAETALLILHAHAAAWAGDSQNAQELAQLASTYHPIPLDLIALALNELVPPQEDWIGRLDREYRGTFLRFEALRISNILQAVYFDQADSAFERLASLVYEAGTQPQRKALHEALLQVSNYCKTDRTSEITELTHRLIPPDDETHKKVEASTFLAQGNLEAAKTVITAHGNQEDSDWLQLEASALAREGRFDDAIDCLERATRLLARRELFWTASKAALQHRQYPTAERVLLRLLERWPDDEPARYNAGLLQLQRGDFAHASEHFRHLLERSPTNPTYAVALADALRGLQRIDEAIHVLTEFSERDAPPADLLTRLAGLWVGAGNPQRAFDALTSHRDRHWSDPEYVALYLQVAYASDHEDAAHLAFRRIRELQTSGALEAPILSETSIDQLRQHIRHFHERERDALHRVRLAQAPWVALAFLRNLPPILEWAQRTQPLPWIADGPRERAHFTLYATHGALPRPVANAKRLRPPQVPPPGTPIVADLTALITLSELGLLPNVGDYFGKVSLPLVYAETVLEDSSRLQPHQLSRPLLYEELLAARDAGRVSFADTRPSSVARVHEYDDGPFYKLTDVRDALVRLGCLPDDDASRLETLPHQRPFSTTGAPVLERNQQLAIDVETFSALRSLSWLDVVLSTFDVQVDPDDQDEILSGHRSVLARKSILNKHEELWNTIATIPSFVYERVSTNRIDDNDDTNVDRLASSLLLALNNESPILADDRYTQALYASGTPTREDSVFGSYDFVEALAQSEAISITRCADAFLRLVSLRYRFLLPSPRVLKALSDRHRTSLPGDSLRSIAAYVHECFRDPGLLQGMEPTVPPTSQAVSLLTAWISTIADFLVLVGSDDQYTDEACRALTEWTALELVPAPIWLAGPTQVESAAVSSQTTVAHFLIRCAGSVDWRRANAMLTTLRNTLSVGRSELQEILARTLDHVPSDEPDAERLRITYTVLALSDSFTLSPREQAELRPFGISRDDPFSKFGAKEREILLDHAHPLRVSARSGPTLIYQDPAHGQTHRLAAAEVATFLFHKSRDIREATLDEIERVRVSPTGGPSDLTWQSICEQKDQLLSGDDDAWNAAAISIYDRLSSDWLFHLAGYTQAAALRNREDTLRYGALVFTPPLATIRALLANPPACFCASATDLRSELSSIVAASETLGDALTIYDRRFGHIPLGVGCTAGDLVARWIAERGKLRSLWSATWLWFESCPGVQRLYHACQVLCQHASLIPPSRVSAFWGRVLQVVAIRDRANAETDVHWHLRANLFRHFLYHLQTKLSGGNGEEVCALAWWMSDRVTALCAMDHSAAAQALETLQEDQLARSVWIWNLARPASTPHPLREASLDPRLTWSRSLLGQIETHRESLPLSKISRRRAKRLVNAICVQIAAFPSSTGTGFAFEIAPMKLLDQLIPLLDDASRKEPLETKNLVRLLEREDELVKTLRETLKSADTRGSQEWAIIFVHWMSSLVRLGQMGAEHAWPEIRQVDRWETFLRHASTGVVSQWASLACDLHPGIDTERAELPHLLARAAELLSDQRDKRRVLFGQLALACVQTGTVSALQRLLNGKLRAEFREEAALMRDVLRQGLSVAPAWVAGRVRAVLAALPWQPIDEASVDENTEPTSTDK